MWRRSFRHAGTLLEAAVCQRRDQEPRSEETALAEVAEPVSDLSSPIPRRTAGSWRFNSCLTPLPSCLPRCPLPPVFHSSPQAISSSRGSRGTGRLEGLPSKNPILHLPGRTLKSPVSLWNLWLPLTAIRGIIQQQLGRPLVQAWGDGSTAEPSGCLEFILTP